MAKYKKTGVLPVQHREGFFADVSRMGDYRTALENIRRADDHFMSLPSEVRKRFGNDAAAYLDFISDPNNRAEMVQMGLIENETGVPPEKPVEEPAEETQEGS